MAMRRARPQSTHLRQMDREIPWEVWGHEESSVDLAEADVAAMSQEESKQRDGIMYIIVTGLPSLAKALLAQDTWMTRLRRQDRAVHVCGEACTSKARVSTLRGHNNRRLRSVLTMPDTLLANCTRPETGKPCNGYHKANLKFPFGLVHTYRRLVANNETLPKWWVLKDEDVYVDVKNFTAHLASHDAAQPIILATLAKECPGVCGSGSVVLSWKLAEQMARAGDEWLAGMTADISTKDFYWDQQLPFYARKFVPSVSIVDDPYLEPYGPFDDECTGRVACKSHWHLNRTFHQSRLCKCASSESPATWHVKKDFVRALDLVDAQRGVPDLQQQ